ncbi:MAG: hypothetical protein ACYCWE_21145 [Eubacteriales bacterium]
MTYRERENEILRLAALAQDDMTGSGIQHDLPGTQERDIESITLLFTTL